MTNLLNDFFRPDLQASNRALKKYLESEGLQLDFRDLVLLRAAAVESVYLSFALLESWSSGDFSAQVLKDVLAKRGDPSDLRSHSEAQGYSYRPLEPKFLLLGVEGELTDEPEPHRGEEQSLVPILAVYGRDSMAAVPSEGGAWNEEDLQTASLTLLDAESEAKLVESFRYLFRAAPNGTARAAVVATALGRHRQELNREVAEKLEEVSPALGQALRRVFDQDPDEAQKALHFLLQAQTRSEPPVWANFWSMIRKTVLESLTQTEQGCRQLRKSLSELRRTESLTGVAVLTHRLFDLFLAQQDQLTSAERADLLCLLERWCEADATAVEVLKSHLDLATEIHEKILLGEALRRYYEGREDRDALDGLMRRFAEEALTVGSTAGSIALGELLVSFGSEVLENTALSSLSNLSERQVLNATAMWELLVDEQSDLCGVVANLFVGALDVSQDLWGLLLKSPLMQRDPVREAFALWCRDQVGVGVAGGGGDATLRRRQLALVAANWTLGSQNRPFIAEVLGPLEWDAEELWAREWSQPVLNFQRLGWFAQCLAWTPPRLGDDRVARMIDLLDQSIQNPYFWDFVGRVAGFPGVTTAFHDRIVEVGRSIYLRFDAGQEDERELFLEAAASARRSTLDPESVMQEWGRALKEGSVEELWWVFGLIHRVFQESQAPYAPTKVFVSELIQRLFRSKPDSMQQTLNLALRADEPDMRLTSTFSLELQALGLKALAKVAEHPGCNLQTRQSVQRRLVLFLQQWGLDLGRAEEMYSFRSTPLFTLIEPLITRSGDALQVLLDEVAATFLTLQRRQPGKLALATRQSAQRFFTKWVACRGETGHEDVETWRRILSEFIDLERSVPPA